MGARRDDLMDATMVRMPDGSYLPAADLRNMNAMQLADLYKIRGGFGSTLDTGTGIQSAQEMFNQTYEEAMANEYLANILEGQGVPDVVPFTLEDTFRPVNVADGINEFEANYVKDLLDQGLVTIADVARQTGIAEQDIQNTYNQMSGLTTIEPVDAIITEENLNTTNLENDLLNDGVDMLDPNVTGLGGDESIITDDEAWDAVDKTKDLASIFQDALDIFGAYDRNSIRKVVDIVNDRGVSAEEVARITGNTVESINQAAAESDTAINNQGTTDTGAGDTGVADTGVADTGDVFNEATDTLNTGEVLIPSAPEGQDTTESTVVEGGDAGTPNDTPVTPNETPVLTDETPVIPVLDTPVIAEDPNVIVNDTPILPTIMQPTPKQTTNMALFQFIHDTPDTNSLFFEPKFTELDNIPVGMFERFMQATGGR